MSSDELELPPEGFVTLSIAFTKEAMDRAIEFMKQLHAQGHAEEKVLAQTKKLMREFSSDTLRRLYDLAMERPIAEDFAPGEILSQRAAAKDTLELELARPRMDLLPGSIVRFMGANWYVTRVGPRTHIRRIV